MVFDPTSAAEVAKKEEDSRIAGKTGSGWFFCCTGMCLLGCTGEPGLLSLKKPPRVDFPPLSVQTAAVVAEPDSVRL
jgi:hypothetical protein